MTHLEQTNQVAEAIDSLGGDTAVAKLAGLKTAWAVSKWRQRLPPDRVLWLSEQTGWKFTPHQLARKLYPNPTDGMPKLGVEPLPYDIPNGAKHREAEGPIGRSPPDITKLST